MLLLVTRKQRIAENVVAFTLSYPDGRPLPPWTPGAHVDIALEPGLSRQYSLTGSEDSGVWLVAVLRVPAGRGSRHLHDMVAPGSILRVDGPRNDFPLVPARRYVFIAGGIGITPIVPMVSQVERSGAEWQLYYGGRRRASMVFLDELARYGDRVHVYPEDERGLLPLSAALCGAGNCTQVYCCGPDSTRFGNTSTMCPGARSTSNGSSPREPPRVRRSRSASRGPAAPLRFRRASQSWKRSRRRASKPCPPAAPARAEPAKRRYWGESPITATTCSRPTNARPATR